MIYGKLLNGHLTDIFERDPITWDDGGVDVPLTSMPLTFQALTYDANTQSAVVVDPNIKAKLIAKGVVVDESPMAKAARALGRIIMAAIHKDRQNQLLMQAKINEIATAIQIAPLNLDIEVSTWTELLTQVRQVIDLETDPTAATLKVVTPP